MTGASPNHPLGQACALLTAIVWGYALVLFKQSGERISPIALNLFKNAVGLVLLMVTLAALIGIGYETWTPLQQRSLYDLGLLALSGVLGIAVADTLFFRALNLIGVGLISIVDCCYSPFVILFAWLFVGEQPTVCHYIGTAFILLAVFTASQHGLPEHRSRGQIVGGMVLAAVAVGLMALGIVMVKPLLAEMSLVWSTILRLAAGFVSLAAFALVGHGWRRHWTAFVPTRGWKYALPASILGTYVCLLLWMAGFKYTLASVAGALNQTSVIAATLLAALILKERFGARQIAALVLGIIGVMTVTFGDSLLALVRPR